MKKEKPKTETGDLVEVIVKIYEKHDTEIRISPAWLATAAMRTLDRRRQSPPLVYKGCHLQLRQLARAVCRTRFEQESDTHEMFPDLQRRYPTKRDEDAEPQYVLLEHLTEDDVNYNYGRLYSEAQGKMKHADALLAWWKSKAA
jgi:hypothetical protein